MSAEFDVVIVGAGGSGLAAALSAASRGGRVLVLEKGESPGGTTSIAVGSFTASGTSLQREAGIRDDAGVHAEDAGRFAPPEIESRNNPSLRAFFLAEAAATFEWLRGLGLTFQGPSPEPPNRAPRMHNVVPGAKAYIACLQRALYARGGEIRCGARVTSLLRRDGRVRGVLGERGGATFEVGARRGVILAAGDYSSSPGTIARFKGERFRPIDGVNPHAAGDGHRLAAETGASLVNMDVTYGPELRFVPANRKPFQQLLPAGRWSARILGALWRLAPETLRSTAIRRLLVTWQHPEDALFEDGAILVNREGERFTDERKSPEREIAVAEQPGKVAYILLDGRLAERYSAWPHFVSTAPDIAYAYVEDYRRLRPDVTVYGRTLEEVAITRRLDGLRLQEAVADFNRCVWGETTDRFGSAAGDRQALERPPWILLGPVKAYFTTTEGGVSVTERLEALDAQGRVIPGLYAVGQNGLGGMVLWGHGLHIAWALTSGRLAGEAVMGEAG